MMHPRSSSRNRLAGRSVLLLSLALVPLCGCERAPAFNILGSFFPGWIACMAAGILLTAVASWIFSRFRIDQELKALPLVYLSLSLFFACTLWLIFFE